MWQELRNQAATACFEYVQEAGLLGLLSNFESSHKIKTWVPETLKAQTAAYALQWHRAIPIKGIIIGQSPTPYDKGSPSSNETAPHLAASFAFMEGAEPPAASEILGNEFRLCGKDGGEALDAIRDCWNLVEHGVLSVHALPLGMENRFDWSPATESDLLQMQLLAKVLSQLISLSAEMQPRGSTRVVAMGRWAHDLASELRRQFTEKLHAGQSKYWTLDIRASLSHPTRTWHKFQTRTPESITMGREEDLLALYELFSAGKNGASTLLSHNSSATTGPVPLAQGRSRVASYLDGIGNGMTGLKAAKTATGDENGGPLSRIDDCNPIGYSRISMPFGGFDSEPGAKVLSEIQVDSNRLDISGNGHGSSHWRERGARAERIVPVFGTSTGNSEQQEHKFFFNREDFHTRAA